MMHKLELYIESEKLEQIKEIFSLDEHDLTESDDCLDLVETIINVAINEWRSC